MKKVYIMYDARAEYDTEEAVVLEASSDGPVFCEWPDDSVCFVYDVDESKSPAELINEQRYKTYGEMRKKKV